LPDQSAHCWNNSVGGGTEPLPQGRGNPEMHTNLSLNTCLIIPDNSPRIRKVVLPLPRGFPTGLRGGFIPRGPPVLAPPLRGGGTLRYPPTCHPTASPYLTTDQESKNLAPPSKRIPNGPEGVSLTREAVSLLINDQQRRTGIQSQEKPPLPESIT